MLPGGSNFGFRICSCSTLPWATFAGALVLKFTPSHVGVAFFKSVPRRAVPVPSDVHSTVLPRSVFRHPFFHSSRSLYSGRFTPLRRPSSQRLPSAAIPSSYTAIPQPPSSSTSRWRRFWKFKIHHSSRTVWYRILHGKLPTRLSPSSTPLTIPNDRCLVCLTDSDDP